MNTNPALIIPSVGRTVHYVLPNGEHRAAIIVRVFDASPTPASRVNLQVFLDGVNDAEGDGGLAVWRTSVLQDAETMASFTWHSAEPVPYSA